MIFVLAALFGVLFLYVLFIFAAVWFSVYPIRVVQYISPGIMGFDQQDVTFESSDGIKLSGWLSQGSSDLVVIAVHGYLMNRCEWVPLQQAWHDTGATFLYFDLRAHGWSSGKKSGLGRDEAKDVSAAIAWARQQFPRAKIVLLGSSMGGAACVLAASEAPELVDGLILDGAFYSLEEAVQGWWPFLVGKRAAIWFTPTIWIGPLIIGFKPKSVHLAGALRSLAGKPMLFMYGDSDPLIPRSSALAAHEAAGANAKLVWFEGATHGTSRMREPVRFANQVKNFLVQLIGKPGKAHGATINAD